MEDLPLSSLRDALLEEHERIDVLLGQVLAAVERNDSRSAMTTWGRFRTALVRHLDAEDNHLIPSLPRAYEVNARVLTQEHQHLRSRASALNAVGPFDAKQLSELRTLRDVLRAHTKNDDRLLYGWLDAQLDETARVSARDALADRLHALE